jgi:hypothetical protein
MTAPVDYNAVLADLEAKRGQIDAAINVIRALMAVGIMDTGPATGNSEGEGGGAAPLAQSPRTVGTPAQIMSDTFFGLSTSQAIKKFLNMVKRPQTPKAIADALHEGGQVHAADPERAYTNVYTALTRTKGLFAKTRTGDWGLAEWYGNKPKGESE